MAVCTTLGTLLACALAVAPVAAQGHGSAGTAHGNPHTGAGAHGTPHAAQGPKNPNPGAARSETAGKTSKAGHPDGAHGPKTAQEQLATHPQLSQRLQGMLPAGMTVDQAAAGFKNLGQFVAAVHVSKNLGIPFDQLKAQMTGSSPKSLGAAIHTLKPDADASGEVERAEQAAHDMTDDSDK
jgi:hypothetical protein